MNIDECFERNISHPVKIEVGWVYGLDKNCDNLNDECRVKISQMNTCRYVPPNSKYFFGIPRSHMFSRTSPRCGWIFSRGTGEHIKLDIPDMTCRFELNYAEGEKDFSSINLKIYGEIFNESTLKIEELFLGEYTYPKITLFFL